MKKLLLILLVGFLTLTAVFFWRGGHHALAMGNALKEWLDEDDGAMDFSIRITGQGEDLTLSGTGFWTEYGDRRVWGINVDGMAAYLDGRVLCMDTGRAYTIPGLMGTIRELGAGLILRGRFTKSGEIRNVTMETEAISLTASVTGNDTVQSMTIHAKLPDGTAIRATVIPGAAEPHPLPRQVTDALVLAQMEPPMSITKPMAVLIPAMETLLPLDGELELGISCGILKLSEQVTLSVSREKATVKRGGVTLDLGLPRELDSLSPTAAALLLLRHGDFSAPGTFGLSLPGETATELLEALVPQAAGLGIELTESRLTMEIEGGRLISAAITAEGTVPFLVTTIPVSFSAFLTT